MELLYNFLTVYKSKNQNQNQPSLTSLPCQHQTHWLQSKIFLFLNFKKGIVFP